MRWLAVTCTMYIYVHLPLVSIRAIYLFTLLKFSLIIQKSNKSLCARAEDPSNKLQWLFENTERVSCFLVCVYLQCLDNAMLFIYWVCTRSILLLLLPPISSIESNHSFISIIESNHSFRYSWNLLLNFEFWLRIPSGAKKGENAPRISRELKNAQIQEALLNQS